jgi:trimeric autotransporter adhesin
VINVDKVETYDDAYPAGALKTIFSPGDTIYFRSVVSDPFGVVDINSATVDILDAGGTATAGLGMTEVAAVGALKTYEYIYSIVGLPAQGNWSATVLANEGTEGAISDSGAHSFGVFFPPTLMTLISSNVPSALPGSTVVYSIVTTNTGTGDAISVNVTNDLPIFTALRLDTYGPSAPFDCTAGCPSSGLSLGTPAFSDDDASTFGYLPVSGAGGAPPNYDSNITHWEIPMPGTLPGSSTAFTIQFEVIVE